MQQGQTNMEIRYNKHLFNQVFLKLGFKQVSSSLLLMVNIQLCLSSSNTCFFLSIT